MATAVVDETAAAARGAMTPLPYRVVRRRKENHDNWTLELDPVDEAIEPIAPGQFTMLYAFGVGEVPISTSGDLDEKGATLVHTIRAVGAVTNALCSASPGDVLGVRGPFGNTWPIEEAHGRDLVVVGGGVGLPPLRPIVYHALAASRRVRARRRPLRRPHPRRPAVPQGGRRLARSSLDVDVTVDSAGSGWQGKVGVVTKLIPPAPFDPETAVCFVVGPEIMMRFTARALIDRGVTPDRIWISMERTMRCGVGLCGHCQLGPTLICRDGPVYRWDELAPLLEVPEL